MDIQKHTVDRAMLWLTPLKTIVEIVAIEAKLRSKSRKYVSAPGSSTRPPSTRPFRSSI